MFGWTVLVLVLDQLSNSVLLIRSEAFVRFKLTLIIDFLLQKTESHQKELNS